MTNLLDNYDKMTAYEVRVYDWAKHEDELDYLVAVKVIKEQPTIIEGRCWLLDENGKGYLFSPSTDMNDAMKVLRGKCEHWSLCQISMSFFEEAGITLIGGHKGYVKDQKIERAICIAALIAEKDRATRTTGDTGLAI